MRVTRAEPLPGIASAPPWSTDGNREDSATAADITIAHAASVQPRPAGPGDGLTGGVWHRFATFPDPPRRHGASARSSRSVPRAFSPAGVSALVELHDPDRVPAA